MAGMPKQRMQVNSRRRKWVLESSSMARRLAWQAQNSRSVPVMEYVHIEVLSSQHGCRTCRTYLKILVDVIHMYTLCVDGRTNNGLSLLHHFVGAIAAIMLGMLHPVILTLTFTPKQCIQVRAHQGWMMKYIKM